MCGFCIENAAIGELLHAMQGGTIVPLDSLMDPIYLQEAGDWRAYIRSGDRKVSTLDALIALCRQWADCLVGKNSTPLGSLIPADTLLDLEKWLGTLNYPPEWQWVLHIDGCPPHPLPIDLAKAMLDSYIEGCLRIDPPPDVAWSREDMSKRFLALSVAFDVVNRGTDDGLLRILATESPNRPRGFDALDLWLQRRALHACVTRHGVRFIEEHYEVITIEAILSVVMSDLLIRSDLIELKKSIDGRIYAHSNLEIDDLTNGIEARISQFS
jgi:hypothetical protein